MPISVARRTPAPPPLGPDSAGIRMTPEEYDEAEFEEGYRYELIDGVLIVSPPPLLQESDPNDDLGHLVRTYQESHSNGKIIDATIPQCPIRTKRNKRIADRAIFIGLGRAPKQGDIPAIAVEWVSKGKRNRQRDYEDKRDEYLEIGIQQYWLFDRFKRTLTVFMKRGDKVVKRVLRGNSIFKSYLLPGLELPLRRLFALANRYAD
jgi:Uma2 family endonuclease